MESRIYELINVDHHKNGMALFKCWEASEEYYLKVSLSPTGNHSIINERNGYHWYLPRIGLVNNTSFIPNYFLELKIPEFIGKNYSNESGIKGNEEAIERMINLYKTIWEPKGDEMYMHGDVVLSNLITGKERIYVIDWEHSHKAESIYWGYDIIHMLFIAIYYESGHISLGQKKFLQNCYRSICERIDPSNQILEKPFQNCYNYMNKYSTRFSFNQSITTKFILSNTSKKDLEILDLMIT